MNILIIGGAGIIASHIVDACIGLGHRVAIIDICAQVITNMFIPKLIFTSWI